MLPRIPTRLFALVPALIVALSGGSAAAKSFVTLRDNGTFAKKTGSPPSMEKLVMPGYAATGLPQPEVMSVWTSFPMNGGNVGTLFDPLANDVTGIGLGNDLPDEVFASKYPPTRCMLLHNNFTTLAASAVYSTADTKDPLGFAKYLFLLELSHLWGPAVRLPTSVAPTKEDALMGFSFHWSFWLDAGGGPAGGNKWKDLGDGRFQIEPATAAGIKYSMLDLYLMGLADKSEVPPFGLLENAVAPIGPKDLLWGGAYSEKSFPWFKTDSFIVTATRKTFTIEDIIARNGPRTPAKAAASMSLGIVLVVGQDETDEGIAKLEAQFEPLATSLAPAFHDATSNRGSLQVVSKVDAPASDDAGTGDGGTPTDSKPSIGSSGCTMHTFHGHANSANAPATLVGFASVVTLLVRRRRRYALKA